MTSQKINLSPFRSRDCLAHRLIVSLDEDLPPDECVAAAWLEEIKRRAAEVERGDAQTILAEEEQEIKRYSRIRIELHPVAPQESIDSAR